MLLILANLLLIPPLMTEMVWITSVYLFGFTEMRHFWIYFFQFHWYSFVIFYDTFDHCYHAIAEYWSEFSSILFCHPVLPLICTECRHNWTVSQIRNQRHYQAKKLIFIIFRCNFLTPDFTPRTDLAQTRNSVLLLTSLSENNRHVRQLNRQISMMLAEITW